MAHLRTTSLTLFVSILIISIAPQAQALWKEMTPQQIQEAVEYGRKGRDTHLLNFTREWTVNLGERVGWATLYTPFHSLAYKARKAAMENRELTDKDIKKALESADTLSFSVTMMCDDLYFNRQRPATLRQGEKVTASSYEFLPEICENSDFFPESPAYVASCVYKFPSKDITPDAPVTLVVIKPSGEELAFPFELSKVR